jgi:hypothetical protein
MNRWTTVLMAVAMGLPVWSRAALALEVEPNSSLATAQSVDGHFTLNFSPDIGNGGFVDNTSTTIPHVTVHGTGDGSFDYFSFYFPGPGSTSGFVVLDIDHSSSEFDSQVALFEADGTLLPHNDDYDYRGGADGSVAHYGVNISHDSLVTTNLTTPGTYIVGVARWNAGIDAVGKTGFTGGYVDAEIQPGDSYTLQISVEGVPAVPEPASFALAAVGAVVVIGLSLRQRNA